MESIGNKITDTIIKYSDFKDGKNHGEEDLKLLKLVYGTNNLNKFLATRNHLGIKKSNYKVNKDKLIEGLVAVGVPKEESAQLIDSIDGGVYFGSRNGKVMHISKLLKDGKETGLYQVRYKNY